MLRYCTAALGCAAILVGTAGPAWADQRGNELAYNYAMRCFVASGIHTGEIRHHGAGSERVAESDAYTRKAFDLAYKVGGGLGFSKKRISADMDSFQRSETRRILLESDYMSSTWADCAKIGLMEPLS